MSSNNTPADKYWATLPVQDLLPELNTKIDTYYKWVMASGRRGIWSWAYSQYNATLMTGPNINYSGEQDQYHMMSVNQMRNVVKHMLNLILNQRPAYEPRATNTDADSQKATVLAKGLLNYYLREKQLERKIKTALEMAALYGEGFVTATWNTDDGEILSTDESTQIEIREGDMAYECFEPMDVVRDVALTSANTSTWWIIKKFMNRWDLIARFPEWESELLAAPGNRDNMRNFRFDSLLEINNQDLIEVFEFYHDRTKAVPQGRYTMFTYDGAALLDSVLPYSKMPVYRLAADEIHGQPFGYGTVFDLLSVQEAVDAAYSTIQTNQASYGVQTIAAPRGANITPTQVTEGMQLLEYNTGPTGGKPEVLQLLATAPEIFNHLNKLESVLEQLSGINSVVRGEPPSAGMSGAAMALLQATAVQYSHTMQENCVRLMEDLGTATISTVKDYAVTQRVVSIVGKANRSNLLSFTGKDLSQVNRVQVDIGQALTRTTAGKLELAQMMIGANMITNPRELLNVLETGNLETLTEGPENELIAIRAENESLGDGQEIPALVTDDHGVHLLEHKALLSDPAVRLNPAKMEVAMKHIQLHWELWSNPANAGILAALGIQPAPVTAPAPTAGPAVPGAMAPPAGDANSIAEANQPNLPELPPGAIPVDGALVQ